MKITIVRGGSGLNDAKRAYLAGLFDGEGCAAVIYSQNKKKIKTGEKLYPNFSVNLVISNIDHNVLKDVLSLLGKGGIYLQKNVYNFRIKNPTDAIKLIEIIKPYVKIKKQDLENLENAAKFILQVRGASKRHRWTEEEKKKFHKFADQSKALKGAGKRGRSRTYPLKQ